MRKIHVRTSCPYDVVIERDSLNKSGELIARVLKSKKVAIITDDIVNVLYKDKLLDSLARNGIEAYVFTFPNGERSKNLSTISQIFDFLCQKRIKRTDLLIALGGGVVGDITGFAAAAFLRGIQFVQIPTTLLAQVDSSVGGKTAVNIPRGKNLVGAFKQPALVICDSNTLCTLPTEELSCGMAEVIKYGMIRDEKLFELIEMHDINNVDNIIDNIVHTCIDIKRSVVENDEFDNGERMILNFGHTIGHAIEAWYNYTSYTHGMGVAIGMCMITDKFCPQSLAKRLKKCVEAYNLPVSTEVPMNELLHFCSMDKKLESDNISFIVCCKIGSAEIRKIFASEFIRLMESSS